MKCRRRHGFWQFCFLAVLLVVGLGQANVFAQEPRTNPNQGQKKQELLPENTTSESTIPNTANKPANPNPGRIITDEERSSLRREDLSEVEAAVLPYINNFFATVRLGPEDVLTVDVFDQPIYSRSNIVVPPNGKINYPLIGQILIAGRTTEEIENEITQKLMEYIIDPKVTVQINQVHSLKYMIIGEVASPGIFEMTRRMSLTEGLAKAGYLSRYGDNDKVNILRMQPGGTPMPIKVPLKDIEKGKVPDVYIVPGDTIVVGSNWWKTFDRMIGLTSLIAWMRVIANP
jgi:polysaccharide export outer membrane protein